METAINSYLKWDRELRRVSSGEADEGGTTDRVVSRFARITEFSLPKDAGDSEGSSRLYNPTLVELKRTKGVDDVAGFRPTIDELRKRPGVLIDQGESDLLTILATLDPDLPKVDVEHAIIFLHEEDDGEAHSDIFTQIQRGPPVFIEDAPQPAETALTEGARDHKGHRTFIGVMDDGIPFLNQAYANGGKTRILATWLQSAAWRGASGAGRFQVGRVLTDTDIQNHYGSDETSVYREINETLFEATDVKTVVNTMSHGSHVMSIAAGAHRGLEDPKSGDMPFVGDHILAVQFEPATVLDTSGRRLNFAILHGARWMMSQALLKSKSGDCAPLVINVSYGATAGARDGTGFLETALRAEVARYARWTELLLKTRSPMRVVLPFGNGYRSRVVAEQQIEPEDAMSLDWRILPDDLTASYLEIRAAADAKLTISVALPGVSTYIPFDLTVGDDAPINSDGKIVARVYREVDDGSGRAVYVIATMPTRLPPGSVARPAPAGAWKVEARVGTKAVVSMEVQRDDTPFNYRRFGRQSYLDHPEAHAWDPETRDYAHPAPDCPVTRKSTHASNVSPQKRGAYDNGIYYAGGVIRHHLEADQPALPRYTAAGSYAPPRTTAERPTMSVATETSHALGGMLALGTRTGSVGRLGGTSVAAPQLARRLLELLADAGPFATFDEEVAALGFMGEPGPRVSTTRDNELARRGLATLPPVGVIPTDARDRG